MTIPEKTRRAPASPAIDKPSLMGGSREAAGTHDGDATQPMRMLDGRDGARPGQRPPAPNRVRSWLLAVSLTMLAVAALSWWQQRNDAASPMHLDVATRSAATAREASSPAAEPEAPRAFAVADAASSAGPTSIERSSEVNPLVVSSQNLAQASSAAASAARATESRIRTAAAPPAEVAAVDAVPRPVTPAPADAPLGPRDADVTLLTAMLARPSGNSGSDAVAQRSTIAQLVDRCESRNSKGSVEAVECRRRICAGYWGKAQACPMALRKD